MEQQNRAAESPRSKAVRRAEGRGKGAARTTSGGAKLKTFLAAFNRASTKYLNNYLTWNNMVEHREAVWQRKLTVCWKKWSLSALRKPVLLFR